MLYLAITLVAPDWAIEQNAQRVQVRQDEPIEFDSNTFEALSARMLLASRALPSVYDAVQDAHGWVQLSAYGQSLCL